MSNNMSSPLSDNKQSSPPPNNSDLESLNSSDNEDNNTNDKAHSFRERRLTYTRHHVLSDNAAAAVASLLADGTDNDFSDNDAVEDEMKQSAAQLKDVEQEEEEGGAAPHESKCNEKRKLTNNNNLDVEEQPKKKKPRISIKLSTNSSTTTTSNTKQLNHLPSRILHAGEIVRRLSEEEDSSKDGDTRTGLYSHPSHPNHPHTSNGSHKKKWHRRFTYSTKTPDSQLPFPRYQVGTFSCAGLEPLYDSDYGSSSSDEEESWDGNERDKREENGGWDKEKKSDEKESEEDEDCGSSGDGGIYANNSSPSNAGRGKVLNLPTSNPNKSPISPIKKRKNTTSKINQDRGGITYPYANSNNMALFSVYDGHGEKGELVSQFALGEVGRLLEERLVSSLDSKGRGKGRLKGIAEDNEEESDQDNNNNQQQQQLKQQQEEYIRTSIKQVFNQVDNDLLKEEDIEPMYSGTTACIVLLKESKLYIGNCGDSRAVLAKKKKKKRCHTKEEGKDVGDESDRELITVDLSTDQNPDSPGEKERILSLGGFVSPPPEPGLSSRVWLDSSHTQIGLAMARSIGDHAVKGVGVISEPEVTTHTIDEDVDEFVIIATDGVWEFLSSEDAVDIVQRHLHHANGDCESKKKGGGYGASVACEALIKAASDKWHEHEGNYRDDITAIVVRLKDLLGKD